MTYKIAELIKNLQFQLKNESNFEKIFEGKFETIDGYLKVSN